MNLLAITHHGGIRLAELGFLLGVVAGVMLALGGVSRVDKKVGNVVAGIALIAGSLLLIVAVHWGHFT